MDTTHRSEETTVIALLVVFDANFDRLDGILEKVHVEKLPVLLILP